MPLRPSQLTLRIDPAASAADAAARWCDGAAVAYLGGALTLRLDTALKDAARIDDELHLPLPPEATPRQIRDRAETWLRERAEQHFAAFIAQKSALAGRHEPPALRLSFASRAHWVELEADGGLRCHWRLIEQSPATIANALSRALRQHVASAAPSATADLFA